VRSSYHGVSYIYGSSNLLCMCPKFDYFPNAAKTWLLLVNSIGNKMFGNTAVNATADPSWCPLLT